jgi:hypothetical protein
LTPRIARRHPPVGWCSQTVRFPRRTAALMPQGRGEAAPGSQSGVRRTDIGGCEHGLVQRPTSSLSDLCTPGIGSSADMPSSAKTVRRLGLDVGNCSHAQRTRCSQSIGRLASVTRCIPHPALRATFSLREKGRSGNAVILPPRAHLRQAFDSQSVSPYDAL